MNRLPVSCCYILKNEEEFLADSLGSVVDHVEEIIICDSGSTDRSLEIAEAFRARVPQLQILHRQWTDDYSAARNFVAEKAKQPWILFVDGDEWLQPEAWTQIEICLQKDKIGCFSFLQKNYSLDETLDGAQPVVGFVPPPISHRREPLVFTTNHMERLYRNNLGLKYRGVIHESLILSCQKLGIKIEETSITLHHFGRLKKDVGEKYLYYLRLTREKLEAEPTNPAPWIELMVNLMELKEYTAAFECAENAMEKFRNFPEVVKASFQSALRADQWQTAEKWIRSFLSMQPSDLYARSQLTTALLYQGKFREVMSIAEEIFQTDPQNFVTHVNCATVFFEFKEWEKAARHIAAGLKMKPNDPFLNDAMSKIPSDFQIH